MSYIIDTNGAFCDIQFAWPDSAFSDRVLSDVVDQGRTCICYGLTAAEASRAVINLKQDCDIPKLSSMELVSNCSGEPCKGYHSSATLEWITRESVAEDSAMKLNFQKLREDYEQALKHQEAPETEPAPEKAGKAGGIRHAIDEWEPILNTEEDMMRHIVKQPLIISLMCSDKVLQRCRGGLLDPYKMQKGGARYSHSMLVTGYGSFLFPDRSDKNFWLVKNSLGPNVGVDGYFYILRNSSQSAVHKYVTFNPIVPLSFAKEENYDKPHLVKEMSFEELEKVEMDLNLDIIIMFYTGDRDHRSFFGDFERASRMYFTDKDDVIIALVNASANERRCFKYGLYSNIFPKLSVYKFFEGKGKRKRLDRNLSKDGFRLEKLDIDFEDISSFFIASAGGFVVR